MRFQVEVSRFDEATLSHLADPAEYVRRAAGEKAREVAGRLSGFVLGVDTDVVGPDGTVLGKPDSPDHARELLRALSGRTHTVLSALCLLDAHGTDGGITREETALVETHVTFAALSDDAISAYVATGEPYDKAGGYGFQGRALAFVERLDGDPSSVIGLPLATTVRLLEAWNIPLWRAVVSSE